MKENECRNRNQKKNLHFSLKIIRFAMHQENKIFNKTSAENSQAERETPNQEIYF